MAGPIWYLDTSVALHALLPTGDSRAAQWIDHAHATGAIFSSALLELEMVRALRREALPIDRAGEVLDRVNLISINDAVLRDAASIEPHIRSLDAIHLASCFLLGGPAVLATHDTRMAEVARGLGYDTLDPLS